MKILKYVIETNTYKESDVINMINNKLKKTALVIMCLIVNIFIIFFLKINLNFGFNFSYDLVCDKSNQYQLFYTYEQDFGDYVINKEYNNPEERQTLDFNIPRNIKRMRVDLGEVPSNIYLSDIKLSCFNQSINIANLIDLDPNSMNDIEKIEFTDKYVKIISSGNDPYITINFDGSERGLYLKFDHIINIFLKLIALILFNLIFFIAIKNRSVFKELLLDLYQNRKLILNLSKNDFKTKFAGSYLGITWAFVQPVVVVIIYWFIFEVGFKSQPMDDFPYLLWLIAGIVPWFFFNEAINNATNSFIEYSYLVKKVVFKISILPVVKVMSAFYVHLFFILFGAVVYIIYGNMPTIYIIQALYYSMCTFVLSIGIVYITSSIIIFFKDLGQIVSILLQFGMWMVPIMYSETMMPEKIRWLLKINPMYYVVEGYRDSFIRHIGFWTKMNQTIYFWAVALIILIIGAIVFKKLKPHFSDVL